MNTLTFSRFTLLYVVILIHVPSNQIVQTWMNLSTCQPMSIFFPLMSRFTITIKLSERKERRPIQLTILTHWISFLANWPRLWIRVSNHRQVLSFIYNNWQQIDSCNHSIEKHPWGYMKWKHHIVASWSH